MGKQLFANNLSTTTAGLLAVGGTSVTVQTGKGVLFRPTGVSYDDWTLATLTDGTNVEIVRITNRSGDALTIARAQEGTAAREWISGTTIEARITAGTMEQLLPGTVASTSRLAIAGGVVSADNASAINQGQAFGDTSLSAGFGSRAYAPRSWNLAGFSTLPRDDWNFGSEDASRMTACETVFASSWVDLGNVPLWSASTTYTDGDVVRPTAGGDTQFHLIVDGFPTTTTAVSSATQPTWDTADYGATENNGDNHWWVTVKPLAGLMLAIPDGIRFFPTEVGFMCFKRSATAAPYVSIGTSTDATKLVNNQQLSDITAANMWHRFTALPKVGVDDDIVFKLITKATGTNSQFHGRFYAKGIAINTQGVV